MAPKRSTPSVGSKSSQIAKEKYKHNLCVTSLSFVDLTLRMSQKKILAKAHLGKYTL
jgi:hypothetical protein